MPTRPERFFEHKRILNTRFANPFLQRGKVNRPRAKRLSELI